MMKKYLKSFFSELAYETFVKSSAYTEPNVSYTGEDDITHYNPEESPDVKWEAKYGAKIVEKHDNLSGFIAEHEIPASIGVGEDLESADIKDVVAVIGDKAFKGYRTLKSITLPNTIQRINSYSFSGCTSLSSVTIPSGVTTIGYKAFNGCSGLTNITVEATTPPSIAAGAFDGIDCCIKVPEGTEEAYKKVWWQYADRIGGDCSVTTYTLTLTGNEFIHADDVYIRWGSYGQKITGYGTYTYATTANTLSIDITVAGVDQSYTYEFDPQLPITLTKQSPSATVEVTVEEELPKWKAIARDDSEEQTFTAECDSSSAITEDEIGYVSRVDKEYFREVSAGTCVTDISPRAFLQYHNLENIDIPSVKNIDINAFGYNYNLSAVTRYNNVEAIGNSAFYNCTSLQNAPISDKVTTIGFNAFAYCPLSGNVTIPDSCTYIGEQAFRYCSAMTTVEIGSGITTISGSAFCDCSALTSVTINALVPPTLGLQPFEREGNNFRIYVPCESLAAYREAEGWSYYAGQHKIQAKNCNKYYATYTNGGISIKECDGNPLAQGEVTTTDLAKINIGDCVTEIGASAFYHSTSLTSVTIGSGVTSIGKDAFTRCTSLQSITVNAVVPPAIGVYVFDDTNDCPIYVPAESVDTYKSAEGWSSYADRIQPIQ